MQMRALRIIPFAILLAVVARPLEAQSAGNGYLFGTPDVRLSLHAGYAHASAKSDVFDFVIENLTVERGSFSGPSLGGDLAIRLGPRAALSFGGGYCGAAKNTGDRR